MCGRKVTDVCYSVFEGYDRFFDVFLQLSSFNERYLKLGDGDIDRCDASLDGNGRIDDMIQANIMGFSNWPKRQPQFMSLWQGVWVLLRGDGVA